MVSMTRLPLARAKLEFHDFQTVFEIHVGQTALSYDFPQGTFSLVRPSANGRELSIPLGQVPGDLPDERYGTVPTDEAFDVLVVGLMQRPWNGL